MFLGKDGVLTSWAEGDTLEFLLHIEGVDIGLTSCSLQIISMLRHSHPYSNYPYLIHAPHSEECGALGTSESFQLCFVTRGFRVSSAELATHTWHSPVRTNP